MDVLEVIKFLVSLQISSEVKGKGKAKRTRKMQVLSSSSNEESEGSDEAQDAVDIARMVSIFRPLISQWIFIVDVCIVNTM